MKGGNPTFAIHPNAKGTTIIKTNGCIAQSPDALTRRAGGVPREAMRLKPKNDIHQRNLIFALENEDKPAEMERHGLGRSESSRNIAARNTAGKKLLTIAAMKTMRFYRCTTSRSNWL